jgi:hypothetical protein
VFNVAYSTFPLQFLSLRVALPCQVPSSLKNMHALCGASSLFLLFAVYAGDGGSKADRYGEDRVKTPSLWVSAAA